jgi:hypothetical protein
MLNTIKKSHTLNKLSTPTLDFGLNEINKKALDLQLTTILLDQHPSHLPVLSDLNVIEIIKKYRSNELNKIAYYLDTEGHEAYQEAEELMEGTEENNWKQYSRYDDKVVELLEFSDTAGSILSLINQYNL